MQGFAAISMLVALVVSVAIGARLLWVARRTRALPELLFGIAFLAGGLGQAFGQLGHRLIWNTPGPLATALNTGLFALVVIATLALYGAIWRVFGAESKRGIGMFVIGTSATVIGYALRIHTGDFATMKVDSDGNLIFSLARISLFGWAAVEAFHQSRMLTKRARLGLANPLVANQIWLWGVAALFSLGLTIIIGHNTMTLHRSPLEDPLSTAALMVCVLASTAAMWCAFFPPASLRQRFESLAPSA